MEAFFSVLKYQFEIIFRNSKYKEIFYHLIFMCYVSFNAGSILQQTFLSLIKKKPHHSILSMLKKNYMCAVEEEGILSAYTYIGGFCSFKLLWFYFHIF